MKNSYHNSLFSNFLFYIPKLFEIYPIKGYSGECPLYRKSTRRVRVCVLFKCWLTPFLFLAPFRFSTHFQTPFWPPPRIACTSQLGTKFMHTFIVAYVCFCCYCSFWSCGRGCTFRMYARVKAIYFFGFYDIPCPRAIVSTAFATHLELVRCLKV